MVTKSDLLKIKRRCDVPNFLNSLSKEKREFLPLDDNSYIYHCHDSSGRYVLVKHIKRIKKPFLLENDKVMVWDKNGQLPDGFVLGERKEFPEWAYFMGATKKFDFYEYFEFADL